MLDSEKYPVLYRRRFIPDETVELKDDIILVYEDNFILTKWNVLKPRKDFSHGYSCYFIEKGVKVSRFLNDKNELLYYYCDIIETIKSENKIMFNDLLVDVVVKNDGFVKVMDLGEISEALDDALISLEQAKKALSITDSFLNDIYKDKFSVYTAYFDKYNDMM